MTTKRWIHQNLFLNFWPFFNLYLPLHGTFKILMLLGINQLHRPPGPSVLWGFGIVQIVFPNSPLKIGCYPTVQRVVRTTENIEVKHTLNPTPPPYHTWHRFRFSTYFVQNLKWLTNANPEYRLPEVLDKLDKKVAAIKTKDLLIDLEPLFEDHTFIKDWCQNFHGIYLAFKA